MGRFTMAWASRVCELHQQLPQSPIFLTISSWDSSSTRFLRPYHYRLPLPADVELLVAGVIHNFLFGESLIHAVVRKGSALLVGCFDADTLKFDVLVEVELPNYKLPTGSKWAAEGCWLLDGPIVVAQVREKFLIVQSSACDRLSGSDTSLGVAVYDDGGWHAFVLNFEGIGDIKGVRTLYCGEVGVFEGPLMLLNLQFSSEVDSQSVTFCRFTEGWNLVKFSLGDITSKSCEGLCTSNRMWQPASLGNIVEVCTDVFPCDVCLDLISCIVFIPRYHDLTVSNLEQNVKRSESSYHDIVIGYWSGKVVKYRSGALVAQVDLNNAPMSLQYAVVAEGQGILLCILNGEDGTAIAICAETLLLLKAWREFQDVVIGDFQMVGHDQLLLLSESLDSEALSTAFGHYLIPQQLTDLKTCYFSNIQQTVLPKSIVDARDAHKTESLNAIADCLKLRMEVGVMQMRIMEEQRDERAELVRSSFGLLQEMVTRNACSILGDEYNDFGPTVGKIVKASIQQHGTCGRTWFLVVMVENLLQRALVLQDLSLTLCTIGGPISGCSSVLNSLSVKDNQKHLVTSVSLMDLPDASAYPVLHVLLSAKACRTNATCKSSTETAADIPTCYPYMVWIGQIELKNVQMTGSLNPTDIPLDFREVAPKHTFMITRQSRNQSVDAVNIIKEALRMVYRSEVPRIQLDAVHELVASPGALWADATIISSEEAHMVTLRAEDSKHLSALKFCLVTSLDDEFRLQVEVPYPELLKKTLCCLRACKEEIKQRKSVLQSIKEAVVHDKLEETEDFKTSVSLQCELQMCTDRQFSSLLETMETCSV